MSSKLKSSEEVQAEVEKLKGLQSRVRKVSLFGDDNQEAIRVQIEVLEKRLGMNAIDDAWGDEEMPDFGQNLLDEATAAFDWYTGMSSDAPSIGWAELVF